MSANASIEGLGPDEQVRVNVFFSRGDPPAAATGYSSIQLLHSKVNTKPSGHNFSTDYDPNPDY